MTIFCKETIWIWWFLVLYSFRGSNFCKKFLGVTHHKMHQHYLSGTFFRIQLSLLLFWLRCHKIFQTRKIILYLCYELIKCCPLFYAPQCTRKPDNSAFKDMNESDENVDNCHLARSVYFPLALLCHRLCRLLNIRQHSHAHSFHIHRHFNHIQLNRDIQLNTNK